MQVERDKLLAELRTVEIGVNKKETVEQSTCFVFKDKEVMTYNDEVACHTSCSLDITGAVNAVKFINMLSKWPEDTIEFTLDKGKLKFKGKAKSGFFKIEETIRLPIKNVETPDKKSWTKLPEDFADAIKSVAGCAKTTGDTRMNCIHFKPDYIEASDGAQAGRVEMKTPFKDATLLKAEALRKVMNLGVGEIGFTKNWVHFKNSDNLILSCKKYLDDYPTDTLSKVFKTKGVPTTLPKGLKELVDRLKVFIDDPTDLTQWLKVELLPDRIKITGEGAYGKQSEAKKITYNGKPVGFSINPQILGELSEKNDKVTLTDKVIRIDNGNFHYMSALYNVKKNEEKD